MVCPERVDHGIVLLKNGLLRLSGMNDGETIIVVVTCV